MTWQPIESAPKDGTSVLAFWGQDSALDLFGVIYWGCEEGCGEPIWLENDKAVGPPTHWQPLPEPPEAA